MRDSKIQRLGIILATMLLVCIPSLAVGQKDVTGFPGIPIYPGVETLLDKEYSGATDEDGHPWVWYEFKSKKLKDEWDRNAVDVMGKIISFYKVELKKLGWQYIGEGIQQHHWVKGKEAIAIGSVADYIIAYIRMSDEDAQANFTTLSDKEFIKAYVACVKAAQEVYEKQGIKTMEDYIKEISQGFDEDKLKIELRKAIKHTLKPFKISVGKFRELKSEYEELVQQYIGEHSNEYMRNLLGFMAVDQLL